MRYIDELKGSEGKRCNVIDLKYGTTHQGTIQLVDEVACRVVVKYDNGVRVSVGHSFVKLLGEE